MSMLYITATNLYEFREDLCIVVDRKTRQQDQHKWNNDDSFSLIASSIDVGKTNFFHGNTTVADLCTLSGFRGVGISPHRRWPNTELPT